MRNAVLLTVLLALIAGVVVVQGLGGRGGTDAGLARGVQPSGTPAATGGTGDGALVSGADGSDPDVARVDAAGRDPERDARAGARDADEPSGAGARLLGRVVDATGAPIPGAQVSLRSRRVGFFIDGPPRAEPSSTTTDAGGRFRFERAPGQVELDIEAERFAPIHEDVELLAGDTFDLGDVQLDTGVLLAGRVIDPAGAPVAGVRVLRESGQPAAGLSFGRAEDPSPAAVTDGAGRFRVASQAVGPWRLRFASELYPDLTVEGVTDLGGDVVDDIVAQLAAGATIEGWVSELPAEHAQQVRATPAVGTEDRVELEISGSSGIRSAQVRPDGRFVVHGLAPDRRYRLTLNGAGAVEFGSVSHAAPVYAAAGARDVELRFSRGASLVLQVVDATSGAPLESFTVEGGFEWLTPLTDDSGRTRRSFPDGRVVFEGLRPHDDRASMRLVIAAAGYEWYERDGIALSPESELNLGKVRLIRTPVLRVHVRDARTGRPIAGARVEARAASGGDERLVRIRPGGAPLDAANVRRGTSDDDGLARVSSIPGHAVQLTVRAAGYAAWRLTELELPAEGDVDQDALLEQGGRVTVRVLDRDARPAPRTRLEHDAPFGVEEGRERMDGPPVRATDAAGALVYTMLEPGTHRFRVAPRRTGGLQIRIGNGPDGPDWMEVEVEPGGEHQLALELPRRASVHGHLTEDREPLPGATLAFHDADADPTERAIARMTGGGYRGKSDSSGRYEIDGLRPGRWLLEVAHPARAMPFEVELRLDEGDNENDLELPVTAVETRVLDPDGAPIAGAAVRARRPGAGGGVRLMIATVDAGAGETSFRMGGEEPAAPVLTDEDGRARLRGVTPDVSVVLEVSAAGFETGRSEAFEVALGAVHEGVEVVLAPGGAIVVDVRDERGNPVPGGYVASLTWQGEAGRGGGPEIAPVQDGRARFEDLASGAWEVGLQEMTEGTPGAATAIEPRRIEVQPGKTETVSFTVN